MSNCVLKYGDNLRKLVFCPMQSIVLKYKIRLDSINLTGRINSLLFHVNKFFWEFGKLLPGQGTLVLQ